MNTLCAAQTLNRAFLEARSFNKFTPEPLSETTLRQLYDLLKWGPTAVNSQPARFVFLRSKEAKERLKPCLNPGNVDKTMAAPATVIVAYDTKFYDYLPAQWPAYDARTEFAENEELALTVARRNSSLQGGYLILAARLLGLDCGPMSGFNNKKLDGEFFPDGRLRSNFLVNIGHGDASGNYPRGPRLSFAEAARIL